MSALAASLWMLAAMAQHQYQGQQDHRDHRGHAQSELDASNAQHAMHADRPTVIRVCTQGSFVEAINSVNGGLKAIALLMESSDAKANAALKEVQALVVIALGRVRAEARCGDRLDASYRESYRKVLQNALNQARAGQLPARAKDLAESALAAITLLKQ
jgi:hypothetical protein